MSADTPSASGDTTGLFNKTAMGVLGGIALTGLFMAFGLPALTLSPSPIPV